MGSCAAVVGASGYAGGELLRLLNAHPGLEVGPVVAGSNAGRSVGDLHPQLVTLADRTFTDLDGTDLSGCDVVFLALPHGASAAVAPALPDGAVVVDLGADFRLADPADWTRWYSGAHAGTWPYGLPELPGARQGLAEGRRVANPGCYATAIALSLGPVLAAGLVDPADIVVMAASGTSGAGRQPTAGLLGTEVMGDLSAYKVGGAHQHLAEVRQALTRLTSSVVTMSFTPVLAPMPRGILATCTARLRPGVGEAELRAAMDTAYAPEPFVALLPAGRWPHTAATVGSNSAHVQVTADVDAGRAVVVTAIDNLGKGAAGQALQNANLLLGMPETTGLTVNGVAP